MCKNMNIYPISKVCNSLTTEELNLKFYVPFEMQMKAICRTLESNKFIRELNLQDNWLSVESCTYLASVLEINITLKILNLKECRIGVEGMAILSGALESSSIQELDLSFNSLGNEGLREGKSGLSLNYNLTSLNLGHNEFTEEAVDYLYDILVEASRLIKLDLSWNCFNTPKCMKKLCQGLLENPSLECLILSWNGISSEKSVFPFIRYLKKSSTLRFLDLSNNLIGGPSLNFLVKGVSQSNSLEHLKIGNNVISPQQAFNCAELLAKPSERPLQLIDMENTVVQKRFLNLMERIREQGKNVIYGAVLADYEIHGPYLPKVLFGRCKYLSMKPKKKKNRVDFGHFVLSLPDQPMTFEDFQEALTSRKLNVLLDLDLIGALQNQYKIKKFSKIDCSQLKSDYMVLYPDTQPEPPKIKKPPKEKKSKKKKKGKHEPVKKEEVHFDLQEVPPKEEIKAEEVNEMKTLSLVRSDSKKLGFSTEKIVNPQDSTTNTKNVASERSLKEKTSSILKQKTEFAEETGKSAEDVKPQEQEVTTLNASEVFILESPKTENDQEN
ncbi:leucine-rich repeat-containing protein 74A-like isoform X3 [Harmonia axyridis]|nr:leucine-rich repeat-containing protein 74A-like isoform X3 [Harmonia axyridis]XP_045483089.1 leucine-rich repeat-containing protein 74A-like isoform X3 [Harmonia axyridis]